MSPQRGDGEDYHPETDVLFVPAFPTEESEAKLMRILDKAERPRRDKMRWLAEVVDEGPPKGTDDHR